MQYFRINFECRSSGVRKNRRPALNLGLQYKYIEEKKKTNGRVVQEDIECVYSDMILDGDGKVKQEPIHIFVPEVFKGMSFSKEHCTLGGMKKWYEMMLPPYTTKNPEIRMSQIISIVTATGLHFYRFIVDQCGGCPSLVLGSDQPATAKSTTAKLCLKVAGDTTHFLDPKSSVASINASKSITTFPFVLDDVESKSKEHEILVGSYNGAKKTTLGRGEEIPLAGQIFTKNFKPDEVMEAKDDEGRAIVQIYDVVINEDTEEAYESETLHAEAMDDPEGARDFLAELAPKFVIKDPATGLTPFHDKHKAATGLLAELKPEYGHRKVKSYSLPLAVFLTAEDIVTEKNDDALTERHVEVFKDRETFIRNLLIELEKTDKKLDQIVKKTPKSTQINEPENEIVVHDGNNVVMNVLDFFQQESLLETSKYLKPFTEKNGKQVVAIAHTNLTKLKSDLSTDVRNLKKNNSAISTGIKTFTKLKAERHVGKENTESKVSTIVPMQLLDENVKSRISNKFSFIINIEDDEEANTDIPVSQDFPNFMQSQGRDTILTCKLCKYTSRDKDEINLHMKEHPKCEQCQKSFLDAQVLEEHLSEHEVTECSICKKYVNKLDIDDHINAHEKYTMFGKTLEKGKLKAKETSKKASKVTGYNVFVKENYNKVIKDENISRAEAMKVLGAQWKLLDVNEKKAYNEIADRRNCTESEQNLTKYACPWCGTEFEGKGDYKNHLANHMSSAEGNSLNRIEPGPSQDTLSKCPNCDLMMRKSAIDEHIKNFHAATSSIINISVSENIENVPDNSAYSEEVTLEEEPENQDESSATVEETSCPKVVFIKLRKLMWPAQVLSSTETTFHVKLFNKNETLDVNRDSCENFRPHPELTKGKKKDWKLAFEEAKIIYES